MTLTRIFKRNSGRTGTEGTRADSHTRAVARAASFRSWQQNLGTPAPFSPNSTHWG